MSLRVARLLAACALAVLGSAGCGPGTGARTVRIEMRNSLFRPAAVSVAAGTTITFELINADPIAHEFILGTHAEQLVHERGADESHDGTRGAASLAPYETDRVTMTFAEPATLEYACHRPGHYAFGMHGTLEVG